MIFCLIDGKSTETILAKDPIQNLTTPDLSKSPEEYSPSKDTGFISPSKKAYSASLRTVLDTPELQKIVQKKTEEVIL